MVIKKIEKNKRQLLPLFLLADPEVEMIEKYLNRGDVFALYVNNAATCAAIVLGKSSDECELMNLATLPSDQGKGYATKLLEFLLEEYRGKNKDMILGTSEKMVSFYERFGFRKYAVRANFFSDNYVNPIIEDGVILRDMIVMKRPLLK